MAYDEICMHEVVMSLVDLHKETGVSALDLAKGMLDFGLHPPMEKWMLEAGEYTMKRFAGLYGMKYAGMATNYSEAAKLSKKL